MTAAVSSASPSALSFEPIERLSISGGTPSNSLASNYSTNDTADADAPYDEPDYDRESYREPEAAPEPTLIDRLDTIRESSAKAVAALKEANAAATDDAAEGGIKPLDGEIKRLISVYVDIVGFELKHYEKFLADAKAADAGEDSLRDAYETMRDFLVDVTGVLSEWSEDAALKLELPPFADLLKQMLKELQDVEIESAKAFESFANGSRVWRLASEMEDLQLLVKDDSYEGHEAALTKRFDLIEDVGGRLLGGRPDWETADAQEAIDYQPYAELKILVKDQLATFAFLLTNTTEEDKLQGFQERLTNFVDFEQEIFGELLKAEPDFCKGLEELKGQLTDSKDMVAVLKAYAEKNKTVEEA